MQYVQQQSGMVLARKRPPVGYEFIENHAQSPDVTTRVGMLATKLFRRHIGERAEEHSRLSFGSVGDAGDAEINDLNNPIRRDHDIRRLDVAMDDTAAMSVIKGAAGLDYVVDPGGQRAALVCVQSAFQDFLPANTPWR